MEKNEIRKSLDFQNNITNQSHINLPREGDYKKERVIVINKKKNKNNNNNNAVCECPLNCSLCNFLGKELVNSFSFYKPEDDDESIIQEPEKMTNNKRSLPKVYKPYNFLFENDERIYSLVDRKYSDEGKRNIKNNKKIIDNTNSSSGRRIISTTNYDDLQFDIGPITMGRKMF